MKDKNKDTLKMVINTKDKTVTNSLYEFSVTFQEEGIDPNNDCKTPQDYEDAANDWLIELGYTNFEIEVI